MIQPHSPSILFFGSSQYSLIILRSLLTAPWLSGKQPSRFLQVITTPTASSPITEFCRQNQLTFFQLNQLDKPSASLKLPDLILSADYGLIIPNHWLNLAGYGALNLHPSLLPKYRGATPVPWAVLKGEKQTGISLIETSEKVDSGPIVAQKSLLIRNNDNSATLLKRCFTAAAEMINDVFPLYLQYKSGQKAVIEYTKYSEYQLFFPPKPQPKKSPTLYCRRFAKKDGLVVWSKFKKALINKAGGTELLERKIRALSPWPGVYTNLPNGKSLKIISAGLQPKTNYLLPKMVQLPGKNPIAWKQFLAGYRNLISLPSLHL